MEGKEGKVEWEKKINMYEYLYRKKNGKNIEGLNIIEIEREWKKKKYIRRGGEKKK